jgi:hypothetical protein
MHQANNKRMEADCEFRGQLTRDKVIQTISKVKKTYRYEVTKLQRNKLKKFCTYMPTKKK